MTAHGVCQTDLILQRIVMPLETGLKHLYYHGDSLHENAPTRGRRTIVLRRGMTLRTDTWFNGFFERYWREYTRLDSLHLRLRVRGTGILRLYRRWDYQSRLLREIEFSDEGREQSDSFISSPLPCTQGRGVGGEGLETCGKFTPSPRPLSPEYRGEGLLEQTLSVEVTDTLAPHEECGLLFFEIVAQSPQLVLHQAEWVTHEDSSRPMNLVACYCTFNRAPLLLANVAALLEDTKVAIVVVDQGERKVRDHSDYATLAESAGDRLRLVEQENFGGSGGFTRCLLEAQRMGSATHVLLLDDDATIEPECVRRAAVFLSLARADLAVGGYMLDRRRPREVFEVGSRYWPERLRIDEPIRHRVDRPDGLTPFLEIRHGHFNGWWFFAFPLALLNRVGLPLPLFLRGDDVEFGYRLLRAGVSTVFLPGVAVWHESFELKGRSWQPFYELRNLLVIAALHFPLLSAMTLARQFFSRLLDELLIYDYYESWLLCEAVAAYLRGPQCLEVALGLSTDASSKRGRNWLRALSPATVDWKWRPPRLRRPVYTPFALGG